MNDETALFFFSRLEGMTHNRLVRLIEHFGSLQSLWNAPASEVANVPGIPESLLRSFEKNRSDAVLESWLEELWKKEIRFISILSQDYPEYLKKIHNPPDILYIKGRFPINFQPAVSIVGSRQCTEYGKQVAYTFGKELSENGVLVVSGMAKGIDSMAHLGALDGSGVTAAILGTGVDICYPAENRNLMSRILEKGCVISEFPPGTKAIASNFPMRNRILSGISRATLVVEAGKKSGTLITVGSALEQGRDVFAVPGNITSSLSIGTNDLIREGAGLVTCVNDVLSELHIDTHKNEDITYAKNVYDRLAPDEKLVYDCISKTPVHIDEIVVKTGLTAQSVQFVLTTMEIYGHIKRLSGHRYICN